MKKIFLLLATCLPLWVGAQQIAYAEYFYDTDPGQGAGIPIPIATAADSVIVSATLPTTVLLSGNHNLFIRVRYTTGLWSHYEARSIYVKEPAPPTTPRIKAAEYFFDTDPGQGAGVPIAISGNVDSLLQALTVPTTGLLSGNHNLFIRVQDSMNKWSHYEARSIYIKEPAPPTTPRIKAAEYFYDTDPGQGAGTPIALSGNADSVSLPATLPTTGLAPGVHNLFVRVQDSTNKWSHYEARSIYVKEVALPTAPRLIAAEYFYKTDPGVGNGTPISVTGLPADSILATASLSTTGRISGNDTLYVRVKDSLGRWSQAVRQPFRICPTALPQPAISGNAQYCAGTTLSLSVAAVSGASGYRWVGPGGFSATTQTITRTSLNTSASGVYKVFAIRAGGTACDTSAADSITVTVTPNAPAPTVSITANPTGPVCAGTTVTYTATVNNGGTTPSYQWYIGSAVQTGDTTDTFVKVPANGNAISVKVNSSAACAPTTPTSSNTLTAVVNPIVTPAVAISANPMGAVCAGTPITYTATPTHGGSAPTYQWLKNGSVVSSGSTYTNPTPTNGDVITSVLTSNAACITTPTATSNAMTEVVTPAAPPPTVSVSVSPGTTVTQGQQVTFTGTITNGGTAPSYQWRKNGTAIPGATAIAYTTTTLADGDRISLWVRGNAPCATADTASSTAVVMHVTVGVIQTPDGSLLQVTPNPSSGLFLLSGNLSTPTTVSYDIRDLTGRLVYQGTFPETHSVSRSFDLSGAAPGVYLLRMTDPQGNTQQFRLIRQ